MVQSIITAVVPVATVVVLFVIVLTIPVAAPYTAAVARTEEVEVVYLVTHTQYPVLAYSLIYLHTSHTQAYHTGLAVLQFRCEVVAERHVHTKQRRECLVEAHLADVVH